MINFQSFSGFITSIEDFWISDRENTGCHKLVTVENREGNIVNFVIAPSTYFVNHFTMRIGHWITGFHDANAPVPLIFPPRYQALVVTGDSRYENIKVDFFNRELISSDGTLKLNLSPSTHIILENDQIFTGSLGNRNLIVIYGASTRSIPAQTTPRKIIVLC